MSSNPISVIPARKLTVRDKDTVHLTRRIAQASSPKWATPEPRILSTLCGWGADETITPIDYVPQDTPVTCQICLRNLSAEERIIGVRVAEGAWVLT